MQQGAQLCFNGNFLVDRSEYPPLASRVLTSSGVAALPRRRDAHAQDGAQGHLSSEGLGGDPKHRGAIRPKPQCKLSRVSERLTIYTNPRLQTISYAIMPMCARRADWMSRNAPQSRPGGRNHLARDEAANAFPPQQSPDRAGLAELMTTTPALDRAFSLSQSVLRTVPMWQPLRKTESSWALPSRLFALHSLAQRHRSSHVLYSRIDKP